MGNRENRCFLTEKSFFLRKSICRPCFICYILKCIYGDFRYATWENTAEKDSLNMSENTPKDSNGGVNDPLKLRNTDTATLKRIPVANPALASSAAKKTIKLKPLAPRSTPEVSEDPKMTETVPLGQAPAVKPASPSAPVPAPTILLTRAPKPAPASTPQFMSTATAPVAHVSKPPQATPVPASSLGTNEADDKTDIIENPDKFIATSTTSQPVEKIKIKPAVFIKPVSPSPAMAPTVPPAAAVSPAAPAIPQTPKYASTATTAVPSINLSKAPAAGGAQPPKYVSTATGAIPAIKPGEGLSGGAQPPKYVSTATGTIQPIKPGEGAQPPKYVSTATGAMPAIKPGIVPSGGAQPPKYVSTATGTMPTIKPAGQGPVVNVSGAPVPPPSMSSLKLSPVPAPGLKIAGTPAPQVSTATAAIPRPVESVISPSAKTRLENPISVPPGPDGTTTQGMQKQSQAIAAAKMQSGLQSAKPAIKLRPSAASASPDEKLTPSSPTVRLQPKVDSAVTPLPPTDSRPIEVEQKPPAPAAAPPAGNTVTTKIPRSKVVLAKPSMPSAAPAADQPSLRQQGDIAAANLSAAGVAEAEQAIQLTMKKEEIKLPEQAPEAAPGAEAVTPEEVAAEKKAGKDEPNLFFAICAILAFLVVGYMVFALTAQYLTTWEKQQIPVVGFRELDQTLHKK